MHPSELLDLTDKEILELTNSCYAELIRRVPNDRSNLTKTGALNVMRRHMGEVFNAFLRDEAVIDYVVPRSSDAQ